MNRQRAFRIVRILVLIVLGLALCGGAGLVGTYLYFARDLPRVETLEDYRPPIISRVLSDDGAVIAEFFHERRIVVPVSRMPGALIQAFVAAEDDNFFKHRGIDLVSIFRAALKNLKAGGIVQGGSTITQQVAKSLLLSPEKKFSRKIKEAILAWRMEHQLSKDEILYLYLNQIYLGHGAYGVQAAAENYFNKDVDLLTLAECSMLAGLPRAPSRYSPYRHFDRAKERQQYVLKRMVDEKYITPEESAAAFSEELTIQPRINPNIGDAAYFTEQVRRYLEETYGEELLYNGGLQVHATMNLRLQKAAQQAIRKNLHDHDKRQGYRGPEKVLAGPELDSFLAEQAASLEKHPPDPGDLMQGVLVGHKGSRLDVRIGNHPGQVDTEPDHWAGPIRVIPADQPPSGNIDGQETHLPLGSLLTLRLESVRVDGTWELALEQKPLAQSALVALEPNSGLVKVMVGGYDFRESQFNRALQARRQPGSAIKPIIYAAALDKGYTPASIILDTPTIYKEKTEAGEDVEWKPKNYEEHWYGATTFRQALAHSRNVVTIKILEDIGVNYAANYARKLGIESALNRDLTLALGSSTVTPLELARAYAVFDNGGIQVEPTYIVKVVDRDGKILESIDPADFPGGPGPGQRLITQAKIRAISADTAYLVTNLLESVVRNGTGWRAKALNRPAGGKTGTTNDLKDAWFVGFVPQLVAVTWVGYDQERPLGEKETGSRAAAPAWVAFMEKAVADLPPREFPVPDTIEFRPIDPETGLLAPEDSSDLVIEAFAPGTAPTRYALEEKKPRARDFFKLDMLDR